MNHVLYYFMPFSTDELAAVFGEVFVGAFPPRSDTHYWEMRMVFLVMVKSYTIKLSKYQTLVVSVHNSEGQK